MGACEAAEFFNLGKKIQRKPAPYLAKKGSKERTLNRNGLDLPRITPRAVSLRAREASWTYFTDQIGVVSESAVQYLPTTGG